LITIAATMPAADGIAMATELNRRADATRATDDARTHGERQVDALRNAFAVSSTATAGGGGAPVLPSRRTEIQIVIDWRSLLGLQDNPAELLGYGSITAADVRAMLLQPGTVLRRLVTDPLTGTLVDCGTTRYRPDAQLSRFTNARDVTCRYPGCTRNAMYCENEHCIVYPNGPTAAGNVCRLCRRHHRRKTRGTFTYTRPDPTTGETLWTTPLGFTYHQEPASYDEDGPDPGDTTWIQRLEEAGAEARQRWVPPPPQPPPPPEEPIPPPIASPEPPPF
jgi:hypothetical protein